MVSRTSPAWIHQQRTFCDPYGNFVLEQEQDADLQSMHGRFVSISMVIKGCCCTPLLLLNVHQANSLNTQALLLLQKGATR